MTTDETDQLTTALRRSSAALRGVLKELESWDLKDDQLVDRAERVRRAILIGLQSEATSLAMHKHVTRMLGLKL